MSLDRANPPPDLAIGDAWGAGPGGRYEALAQRFRPVLARIRAASVERELERRLPVEEIDWLRDSGLTALRVPVAQGGSGASLTEFFAFLIDLSEADSNLTQALRAHFGFVEHVLSLPDAAQREIWLRRLGAGDIVGGAWSEVGEAKQGQFSTTLTETAGEWRLHGTKFYTTGSLFADWIHVSAADASGGTIAATVRRDAPGVEVLDDWDGMGQRLTASGTSRFDAVAVPAENVTLEQGLFPYSEGFYQLVHLATLAGIARAAATDTATAVAARKRSYSHAPSPLPATDPQLLQVVGRIRAQAYAATALVHQAARALEKAATPHVEPGEVLARVAEAEIEIWQAQTVVAQLVLDATAIVFDALGASATLRSTGFDRYWRNARTIVSHNPRVYKDRIIGAFAVTHTLPPGQWRIGEAS